MCEVCKDVHQSSVGCKNIGVAKYTKKEDLLNGRELWFMMCVMCDLHNVLVAYRKLVLGCSITKARRCLGIVDTS